MIVTLGRISFFGLLLFLGGCFSAQILNTPYQETMESQRDFVDEFDNPDTLGTRWQRVSGRWSIKGSELIQKNTWKSRLPGDLQMIYVDGLASGGYEVEARLNFLENEEQSAGVLLRFQDQDNFYMLRIRHYPRWQDNVDLVQYTGGERREDLRRMDVSIQPGEWYTLRAEDRGNEVIAYLDGSELFRFPTENAPSGTVGLATKTGRVAFEQFSASLADEVLEEPHIPSPTIQGGVTSSSSAQEERRVTASIPKPKDFPSVSEIPNN